MLDQLHSYTSMITVDETTLPEHARTATLIEVSTSSALTQIPFFHWRQDACGNAWKAPVSSTSRTVFAASSSRWASCKHMSARSATTVLSCGSHWKPLVVTTRQFWSMLPATLEARWLRIMNISPDETDTVCEHETSNNLQKHAENKQNSLPVVVAHRNPRQVFRRHRASAAPLEWPERSLGEHSVLPLTHLHTLPQSNNTTTLQLKRAVSTTLSVEAATFAGGLALVIFRTHRQNISSNSCRHWYHVHWSRNIYIADRLFRECAQRTQCSTLRAGTSIKKSE